MDEIKTPRDYSILLRPGDSPDAWGTSAGIDVFLRLHAKLARLPDHTVVVLDYSGIVRADVSFQREAVVETVRRHRPRLLFIASNVGNEDVLANLTAALEARGEILLVRVQKGTPCILGRRLATEHEDTLSAIQEHHQFTSTQLTVPPHGLEASTASARLPALWKAGLIGRIQGASPERWPRVSGRSDPLTRLRAPSLQEGPEEDHGPGGPVPPVLNLRQRASRILSNVMDEPLVNPPWRDSSQVGVEASATSGSSQPGNQRELIAAERMPFRPLHHGLPERLRSTQDGERIESGTELPAYQQLTEDSALLEDPMSNGGA